MIPCMIPAAPGEARAAPRTRWGLRAVGRPVLAFAGFCGALGCSGDGNVPRGGEPVTRPANPDPNAVPPSVDDSTSIDENGVLVLDDLSDGDANFAAGGISGEWFTYSDGTSPVMPPDHTGPGAVDGEAHVSGQGFSEWGAGLSAYFRSADLSPFGSLTMRARGTGTIVVEVATPATSPPAEGGTCMGQGCFGHFSAPIQLGESYQDFDLAFEELTQPSWAQAAELSLNQVISINLVAKVTGGSASIDLWLDRLSLRATGAAAAP